MVGSPFRCRHCGHNVPRLVWQTFDTGTKHIRAECGRCKTFSHYAPQTDANINQALAEPEAVRQGSLFST